MISLVALYRKPRFLLTIQTRRQLTRKKNDKKAGKLTEFFSLHTPKTKVSAKCEHNGTKRWNHVMGARKIASAIRLSNSESNGVLSLVTKTKEAQLEALKIYVTTAGVTEHGKAFGHDLMPSNRHLTVKQVFEEKAFQGIIYGFDLNNKKFCDNILLPGKHTSPLPCGQTLTTSHALPCTNGDYT